MDHFKGKRKHGRTSVKSDFKNLEIEATKLDYWKQVPTIKKRNDGSTKKK